MQAVRYDAFQQLPEVVEVDDPRCPDTGVVIAVAATGLCRSDWHGWMGHDPDIALPHVPGHEFAGVIAAVGPAVRDWRVGDRVTVPFVCACGHCPSCRRGDQQVCDNQLQPGFTHWGSFAQFVAIDRADINLVHVPEGLELTTAAGLGCRFSTAYRAVVQQGQVGAGDWVAVHGCGGVGLSAVMIAAARGARVIAIDVSPTALELARTVGASACVDGASTDVVSAVRQLSDGGVRVSLDALGSTETCQNSIRSLRKRGRHVQVGLMLAGDAGPRLPMSEVIAGELELIGSHGIAAHAYAPMLAEILSGELAPHRLVTRVIPLTEAPAALATLDQRPGDGITTIIP